ncbi:hypothetical protein [Granulicoccus sp. GXG6511]|uniref:hypothetical protein n=1 Tax=Granulicoccus sp. GXG6511 TaxID=3381351 RepID=UPI003D7DA5B0
MNDRRQEDFDRDFTEMVSGLTMEGFGEASHTTRPVDPPDLRDSPRPFDPSGPTANSAPRPPRPAAEPPKAFSFDSAMAEAEPDDPDPSEYTPPPLPPLRTPRGWAALGWACAAYVLAALLLTIVGVRLPGWAGWLAVIAFVAAVFIGWRSLPKDRDPDDDGAVV